MNFRSNKNTVLVISGKEELPKIASFCHSELSKEGTNIITASSGIDGIFAYNTYSPCIVIVDDSISDMRGSSVCSILHDSTRGKDTANIFFIGDSSSYLFKTYADFFFQKPLSYDLLSNILKEFFYRRKITAPVFVGQIGSAVRKQHDELPKLFDNQYFQVNYIFSAFSELSGDGLNYWAGDDGSNLYGFIFDNTGHDLLAYSSTSSIKTLLKVWFDIYQKGMIPNLGKILYNLNSNLFTASNNDPSPVAVVLFHISIEDNLLYYTPAGMPYIYTDYGNGFTPVKMINPIVGGFQDADFENYSLPLQDIKRIMFASDGMSELLTLEAGDKPPIDDLAKHDDVSGIVVSIKRG